MAASRAAEGTWGSGAARGWRHAARSAISARMDLGFPAKMLLVDDEREFVLTLAERLETRNLPARVAYDGEEALAVMEVDPADVVVLDLRMPGLDGLEVLRRVKRRAPTTEVIILTGHGSDTEQERAEELGAFAYLTKPVDIEVLAQTMRRAYAQVQAVRGARLPLAGVA